MCGGGGGGWGGDNSFCPADHSWPTTLSALQTKVDNFAKSVDPDVTARDRHIRIYTVCHSVLILDETYLHQWTSPNSRME